MTAAPGTTAPSVFPVGHYDGPQYPKAGGPPRYHSLRIGRLFVNLSTHDALAVWTAAHRPTDAADEPWTRGRVTEVARQRLGAGDPEAAIDELLKSGVLVEVAPATPDAVGFARHHRVIPLMVGLGNTPEALDTFGLGLLGLPPVVQVPGLVYDILRWGPFAPTLWEVCREYADAQAEAGVTDPRERDAGTVLDVFLGSLHTLLGPNAVYIDEAQPA